MHVSLVHSQAVAAWQAVRTSQGSNSQAWLRVRSQDPAAADKLTRIQRDLDETKVVLHKTKLDALVDKSSDLSLASQMFYKQARKTNSCCKMM